MAGVLVAAAGCPGLQAVNPICQVGVAVSSAAGAVAGAGVGAVFQGLTKWVVDGAVWLVAQIGSVLTATTSVDVGAPWFRSHYQVMLALLGVVVLPMLLGSVVQAVLRQDATTLLRSFLVHLPLAMVLAGGAVKTVQLALAATDALSSFVSASAGADLHRALSGVGTALAASAAAPGIPAFVALLGALLVVLGALALWVELLVRAAAVYVAVLFLPLALASLVWPAVSHWCRRLVEVLAALILSKFLIVAILSLAVGALASGASGSAGSAGASLRAVLAGAALLSMAAFSPYALLRLIPMAEAGAVGHLEGVRHRAQHVATTVPRSAAAFALRQARLSSFDPGEPGTGNTTGFDAPGADGSGGSGSADGSGSSGGSVLGDAPGPGGGTGGAGGGGAGAPGGEAPAGAGDETETWGVPMWQGDRRSQEAYQAVMSGEDPGEELPVPGPPPIFWPPGHPDAPPEGPFGDKSGTRLGSPAGAASGTAPGSPAGPGPVRPGGSAPVRPPGRAPMTSDPAGRGTHVIVRDAMGPVIRWVPPDPNGTLSEEPRG